MSDADRKFEAAMAASDDLIARMQSETGEADPARALLRSIWTHRHNVPFLATVHEATAEMASPLEQKAESR